MAQVYRTPDERFAGLADWPYAPRWLEIDDPDHGRLRVHHVDEGPREGRVVLMLHGNPTWAYLYRKLIGPVVAAGHRAVVPDMVGFGRSDKLLDPAAYSLDRFVAWLRAVVEELDLRHIVLVAQDWGGPFGLRVLSELPDRFDAVVVANTLLPNCEPPPRGIADWPGPIIAAWMDTCRTTPDLPVSALIAGASVTPPPPEALAAYEAPFPDTAAKTAVTTITGLIPASEDRPGIAENRRAWDVLDRFDRPFVTAFSDGDPSTIAWEAVFQARVPGARGRHHPRIAGAGHFVQEDGGEALVRVVTDLLAEMDGGQAATGEPGSTG